MGEYDNALKQFSSMLLKNKKDTDLYYQMAVTYYKKGDFKKVREFGTLYLSFDDNKWEKEILKLLEFCK